MFSENTALSASLDAGPLHGPGVVLRERFVLEERLEHGRLGVVYRAVDRQRSSHGNAFVAVLILPPEITRNAPQLDAFKRELGSVQSLSLSHPHIVDICDFDRDGSTYFLVLEWLDGESLRRVIDSLAPEPLCEADVLDVVRAIGGALVYAHAKGVVHGDVRAENVLVTERREVKLLFGSACLARNAPFAVGPREDLQGLAALAYEMLCGEPPPAVGHYGGRGRGKPVEPPRIAGLSRKRWNALKAALVPRDPRIRTVRQFLTAFDLGEPLRRAPGRRRSRWATVLRTSLRRGAVAAGLLVGLAALVTGAGLLWREVGSDVRGLSSQWTSSSLAKAGSAADEAREALSTAARRATESARTGIASLREAASADSADEPGATATTSGSNRSSDATAETAPAGTTRSGPDESGEIDGEAGSRVPADEPAPERATGPTRESPATPAARDGAARAGAPASIESDPDSAADLSRANPSGGRPNGPGARRTGADAGRNRSEAAALASAVGGGGGARTAPDAITFTQPRLVVTEGQAVAMVEIRRAGDAEGEMDVVWWTRDGSATAGDDYADLGRVVERLADGEASRTLFVPITSDSLSESQESFDVYVGVLSPQGNQSGGVQSTRVTILDDDG